MTYRPILYEDSTKYIIAYTNLLYVKLTRFGVALADATVQIPESTIMKKVMGGKSLSNLLSKKIIISSIPILQRVLANVYTILQQLQVFIVTIKFSHTALL